MISAPQHQLGPVDVLEDLVRDALNSLPEVFAQSKCRSQGRFSIDSGVASSWSVNSRVNCRLRREDDSHAEDEDVEISAV